MDDRLRGAIWGQLVGDAAALGSHWIYDLKEQERRYPGGVQGFEAPVEGHYHYGKQPGEQTHYGDAALVLLDSVAERQRFDEVDFGRKFVAFFRTYRFYRDKSTRESLAHYELDPGSYQNGADDDECATATRLAAILPVDHSPEVVRRLTLVTQNNARAIAYMQADAIVLQELLNGSEIEHAFEVAAASAESEVREKIEAGLRAKGQDTTAAVASFGASCPLPKSFPGAIQAAVTYPTDFRRAIVETLRAGGDNAGRAGMVGAWLGASLGLQAIPLEWRERLRAAPRLP
jgi:ADP-ribosylglycohydrolase